MSFATDATEAGELLTTRQAAELVGRSLDSIKAMLNAGSVPGERVDGFWRIRREDLLAWNATAQRRRRRPSRPHERGAQALAEYGSVTPGELATLLGVHVGNARKYLALLAAEGRAHRHDDGEWFPGPDCQNEEAAS